jgi:hypothetical protein
MREPITRIRRVPCEVIGIEAGAQYWARAESRADGAQAPGSNVANDASE